MALEAGGCGKVDGVAVAAGCSLVVDTASFTANVGMHLVEAGRAPGGGVMALVAGHPREQTGME